MAGQAKRNQRSGARRDKLDYQQIGKITIIKGKNGGNYPFCNSLFLAEDGIIVDPASDYDTLKRLRAEEAVTTVWLSHWHEDHFAFLGLFEGMPLRICAKDAPPLGNIETFLDFYGISPEQYREYWRETLVAQFNYKPREITDFFVDGEEIKLASDTVSIINTPGHTPGHTALYFQNHRALFLGDYDLTPFGPWYGDRDSSLEQTLASLAKLRQVPAATLITSHGAGIFTAEAGEAPWDAYIATIFQREERILAALKTPQTLDELAKLWLIYKKPRAPQEFFEFGERALLKKHLEYLVKKGRLFADEDGKFIIRHTP